MKLGILKEQTGEKRVSMVPAVAEKLLKQGYTMQVETGAGVGSGFSDAAYKAVGCEVVLALPGSGLGVRG